MNEQKQWTSSMTRRGVVYLGRGSHKAATVRAPTFQFTIFTFHYFISRKFKTKLDFPIVFP